jgi:hypothetical protein
LAWAQAGEIFSAACSLPCASTPCVGWPIKRGLESSRRDGDGFLDERR